MIGLCFAGHHWSRVQRTVAVRRLHPHPHIPNIPTNRRASINKCGETRPYRPQAHAHAATMPSPAPVEPRVADHFPRKAKQCEKPAERFFACFSAKGDQPAGGDKEAGRRGLAECQKEMAAYDACMQKWLAKNPGKQALFRVQEEYRASTLQAKQQSQ